MVGLALKKYAKSQGLSVDGGAAYGVLHGFQVSFREGADWKRMTVTTRFSDAEARTGFENALNAANLTAQYRVQNKTVSDNRIDFVFYDTIGTMGVIEKFVAWVLPLLAQYRASGADVCAACNTPMNGQGKWVLIDGVAMCMHTSCANSLTAKIQREEAAAREAAGGSYVSGAIGALLGGLLGAAAWGLVSMLGFITGILGLAIGFLAEKGYTLFKGKEGKGKLVILIVVIVISVLAGTIFGEYLSLIKELKEMDLGVFTPTEALLLMLRDDAEVRNAVMKDFISNGLLGLLFAGLGTFSLLRSTAGKKSAAAATASGEAPLSYSQTSGNTDNKNS